MHDTWRVTASLLGAARDALDHFNAPKALPGTRRRAKRSYRGAVPTSCAIAAPLAVAQHQGYGGLHENRN